MKIIKQGFIPAPKKAIYRGTCLHCGCVIEVDETEVEFDDELPPRYIGTCPTKDCPQLFITVLRHDYKLPAATETVVWRSPSGARVKGALPP